MPDILLRRNLLHLWKLVELLPDCLLKPPSYETVSSLISRLSSQTTVFDQLTLQWVVETGRPMLEATTTVKAEASSMLKPLQEEKEKTHVDVSEQLKWKEQ